MTALVVGMELSKLVNSLGLVSDITGAVMLFRYGLPSPIADRGKQFLITEQEDAGEAAIAVRYDSLARIALGLVVSGFVGQLASNFL